MSVVDESFISNYKNIAHNRGVEDAEECLQTERISIYVRIRTLIEINEYVDSGMSFEAVRELLIVETELDELTHTLGWPKRNPDSAELTAT